MDEKQEWEQAWRDKGIRSLHPVKTFGIYMEGEKQLRRIEASFQGSKLVVGKDCQTKDHSPYEIRNLSNAAYGSVLIWKFFPLF